LVYEKVECRRLDPVEGKYYNLLKDKVSREILGRLVYQKEHTHPVVKRKLQDYRNFLATVGNEYKKNLVRINAEEPNQQVFMNLCDAVENTL
jgi:adenylate kinase family enzyme